MEAFLIYIGKSALAAGAFYLVYFALFQHQKQFVFNRIYLPVSLAISFLIPLITFTSVNYISANQTINTNSFAYLPEAIENTQPEFIYQWYHYLFGIYILGTIGFLFHLLLGHLKAFAIIRWSRLKELFGAQVNLTPKDVHPFSFFNKIVLSEKTLDNPNLEVIVNHEMIHVKEKHTHDILFAEILFLLQWFNPFAWLIKDAIRNNLEYKTDHQITKNNNAEAYQLAMVGLVHKKGVAPFLTALNGSQLKNRIIMMKKKTENKYAFLKQLVVLPLLALLVMSLSNKEVRTEVVHGAGQLKVVVDGVELPTDHPDLIALDFSNGFKGGEVIKALGIENKVISNTLSFDKNPQEDVIYYIRTKDYVPGTNPEFENITEAVLTSQIIVNGKITNEKGKPIPSAAVVAEGTTTGTISDMSGNYEIKTDKNSTLIFSMIGYEKREIAIKNQTSIDVTLKANNDSKPDKIKVIGYGTRKKSTVNEVLQIKASGDGKNQPLYMVDGIEKESIEYLQPDAIESISVLKDESATSLYGEKGENGVIIITTKEAANKKLKNAVVVVDGKKYEGDTSDIDPENIEKMEVLKNESATKLYGPEAKDGAIIITSKNKVNFDDKSPLIMIDGVKSTKDVNDIDPDQIKSIDVLKDASAVASYGAEGKDGVILITTKSDDITSEMDLRKFIAKKMKYPQKAQQANKEGIAELFVKVNADGIIYSVSEKKDKNAINIGEVVVVAYAPAPEEIIVENKKDDLSKSFISVTKSVINQLPKLDIADYKGKTIAFTVKFMLQDK